jgi:DNA polymerase III subunit epsilon
MLPSKIAFVDLETTGARSTYDRIIEIGIVRVENNKIVKTFNTLLNPLSYIPPEIERITGIKASDVENAPVFRQVANEVLEILKDCVFVAHNVRFDYSFLKTEFTRENINFTSKHFCTVRLSRVLFPQHRHHNLDSIIQRFNIECLNRHRALDDARVLYDFFIKLQQTTEKDTLEHAIATALKKPSLPLNLKGTDLSDLPEYPGVYTFYGKDNTPLYVGKSINLKDRILSHFTADIHSGKEMKISQQIERIETDITAGELGALIKESQMVKALLPLYNRKLRVKRELIALKLTKDKNGYYTTLLEPISTITPDDLAENTERPHIVGFFKSRQQAKVYLASIAKEYELCEKLLGLEKTSSSCFAYRLENCHGACIGEELYLKYNMRFTEALSSFKIKPWPFKGPIVISEENILAKKKELFIIDKWCYLGSIKYDDDGTEMKEYEDQIIFDTDIYKILLSYIRNPGAQKKIHNLEELPFDFYDEHSDKSIMQSN